MAGIPNKDIEKKLTKRLYYDNQHRNLIKAFCRLKIFAFKKGFADRKCGQYHVDSLGNFALVLVRARTSRKSLNPCKGIIWVYWKEATNTCT